MGTLRQILTRLSGHGRSQLPEDHPVARRTYLVARGDDLWSIARREYGDPNWWYEIFTANRRLLRAPELLHPGMTLRLP
jgi:nucleoid-associated protein YgaU